MIQRLIEPDIKKSLFLGKTIVIYGPRQVGKTTLVKKILGESDKKTMYYDAESLETRRLFVHGEFERLSSVLSNYDMVVLDEAQKLENIGSLLKLIHDHMPRLQMIVTGSSSFDLSQGTRESMLGRVREFFMMPLLVRELLQDTDIHQVENKLQNLLRYGLYPGIISGTQENRERDLLSLAGGMLYKDMLELENIKKPKIILDLLLLLALQVGGEISYSELAQKLGVSVHTVQRYIYLLEESFIVFTLRGFSRNLRNEIVKSPKIYFYDVGVRNALLENFSGPNTRTDIGALWENFIIAELYKQTKTIRGYGRHFFWRTHDQAEIDYIEERNGEIAAYEIKWGDKASKHFQKFEKAYPGSSYTLINRDNWIEITTNPYLRG